MYATLSQNTVSAALFMANEVLSQNPEAKQRTPKDVYQDVLHFVICGVLLLSKQQDGSGNPQSLEQFKRDWLMFCCGSVDGSSNVALFDYKIRDKSIVVFFQRLGLGWRDLDVFSIGAVYENLLAQKASFSNGKLQLSLSKGSARKLTGSYFTPVALIDGIIETTLLPVLQARPHREVTICDPSCGSGFFLLLAAKHLWRMHSDRVGNKAELLRKCIYGVDINPISVLLSRFALWRECGDESLSLDFFQNNICCGNALIGAPLEVTDLALAEVWCRKTLALGEASDLYNFFHWHLAFPQVFDRGGFDVVIGNPPWERVKLQEKEFFSGHLSEIANAKPAKKRREMIQGLSNTNPNLWAAYCKAKKKAEQEALFYRESGRFPMCSKGDINYYGLFAELSLALVSPLGRIGMVLPSGIWADKTYSKFFQSLLRGKRLRCLLGFSSHSRYFEKVKMQFCLLTVGPKSEVPATYGFQLLQMSDTTRTFPLREEDIYLVNPVSKTCPNFHSALDAQIVIAIYKRNQPLCVASDWSFQRATMFHMTNNSDLFVSKEELIASGAQFDGMILRRDEEFLPLLEGKSFHQFTFDTKVGRNYVAKRHVDSFLRNRTTNEWFLVYRWVARNSDYRTFISSIVPRTAVGNGAPIIFLKNAFDCLLWQLMFGSFVFDYVLRQKLPGANVTFGVLEQLPTLSRQCFVDIAWIPKESGPFSSSENWFWHRGIELIYTSNYLRPFAVECKYNGEPFRQDPARRFEIRCELDAVFFHLFGITESEMLHILDSFPQYAKKERKEFGTYRTKNRITQIYRKIKNHN